MEQQNKYYTPDISELHVGYECEHTTCKGAFDISLEDDIVKDKLTVDDLRRYLRFCNIHGDSVKDYIRTRYLDQSDIESLGWKNCRKLTDWFGKNDKPNQVGFDMQNMMLGYDYDSHILAVTVKDPTKSEDGKTEVYDYPKNVKWFRGECKSINELRTIMKFLNIK